MDCKCLTWQKLILQNWGRSVCLCWGFIVFKVSCRRDNLTKILSRIVVYGQLLNWNTVQEGLDVAVTGHREFSAAVANVRQKKNLPKWACSLTGVIFFQYRNKSREIRSLICDGLCKASDLNCKISLLILLGYVTLIFVICPYPNVKVNCRLYEKKNVGLTVL